MHREVFMAQYYHLNIYKTALELLVTITNVTSKFDRNYRFTLGEKLQEANIEFISLIYEANSQTDIDRRLQTIGQLSNCLQKINIYIRLSCEVKTITKEKYAQLTKYTQDIERQLNGWLNYTNNKISKVTELIPNERARQEIYT